MGNAASRPWWPPFFLAFSVPCHELSGLLWQTGLLLSATWVSIGELHSHKRRFPSPPFLPPSFSLHFDPSPHLSGLRSRYPQAMNAHHRKRSYRPPPPKSTARFSSGTVDEGASSLKKAVERVPFGWQVRCIPLMTFYSTQS